MLDIQCGDSYVTLLFVLTIDYHKCWFYGSVHCLTVAATRTNRTPTQRVTAIPTQNSFVSVLLSNQPHVSLNH
jgi:hypothetical protein